MSARNAGDVEQIWRLLVTLVMDSRGDWRRQMVEVTGLPFSRVRALRRLVNGPLTLRELAEAMVSDAPATTVAVDDLEKRGFVRREVHPTDRRAKLVTITAEGRRLMDKASKVTDRPPDALLALAPKDLASLRRLLETLDGPERAHPRPRRSSP